MQNKSPNVFFDVQKVLPNVLSKDDWCYLYRDQVYPFIDEEIFRELYPSETGRPNTPIKKAVSILIFMDMERHTWCPVKIGVWVATLTIDEASYAGAARHHQYMENTDYRKRCAIRAGAEATVSEMVRAHGVRRSKHRTEGRTRLQSTLCCYRLQCKKIHQAWGSARVRCVRYCGNAPFRRCFCCTNGLSLIFSSCFITHLCL